MTALVSEMAEVARRLGPSPGRQGRAVQFVAARSGDGVSSLARAFAEAVAQGEGRAVWLVELDLANRAQATAIAADPKRYGPIGPAKRSSPDGSSFFTLEPPLADDKADANEVLAAHQVGEGRMWVTRLRNDALAGGRSVRILDAPEYWTRLRRHAEWIVVDAPALDRSSAALAVARNMDANLLVIDSARGDIQGDLALRDALLSRGGAVSGVVLTPKPHRRR